MADPSALTWTSRGDQVVIRAEGYLNRRLGREVALLVQRIMGSGRRQFLIDLEASKLVNHEGLGELLDLRDRIRQDKGTLRLCGGTPTVRKILRILEQAGQG